MAKECIQNCPRIQAEVESLPEGAHPKVLTKDLLEACEDTYECAGPEPAEGEVVIGFFRKHTETQPGLKCGLSN